MFFFFSFLDADTLQLTPAVVNSTQTPAEVTSHPDWDLSSSLKHSSFLQYPLDPEDHISILAKGYVLLLPFHLALQVGNSCHGLLALGILKATVMHYSLHQKEEKGK